MSGTVAEIILLTFGGFVVLALLTALGEFLRARVPVGQVDPVIETFVQKVNSWWVMVVLFSLALLTGLTGVTVLFAFASFAALREFYTLSAKARADHLTLAAAFFIVLPLQFLFVWLGLELAHTVFIPVFAYLLLPVLSVLRGNPQRFMLRVAEMQWGLMICVYCVSHVPALMLIPLAPAQGPVTLIAFLVVVVQVGDLVEIYTGRMIGRSPVVAGLSPKTWEGVVCGLVAAAATGALLVWITPFAPLVAMAVAFVASACGMAGTLVFAAIKRDKGIRDWSHLIPGQGGLIDQLDSVIFAAPIFYYICVALLRP